MELSTGSPATVVSTLASTAPQSLLGYQILPSEHLPQANFAGDVLLADLKGYCIFGLNSRRGDNGSMPTYPDLEIAYTEYHNWIEDQTTWKFRETLDGMPWLRKPITLADPQAATDAYEVSPFVMHNK